MEDERALYASINDPVPRKPRLRGSQFLDTAEQQFAQAAQTVQGWAEDREGIGDDITRLGLGGVKNIAKVVSLPGISHALRIAGAPAWAAGQAIGAGLEHGLGVDPRYGHIAGEVGEWFIPGYGVTKLGKAGKLARKIPVPGTKTALGTVGAMRNPARIPKATVGELSDRALQQLDNLPTDRRLLDIEEANRIAAQNARDTYTSTKATVTSDPTDIQVYDLHAAKKAVKADIPKELGGKLNTLTRIPEAPSKQFHHIFLKDLASEYVQAARSMGTSDEVIQLDRIAKKYGFGLGNYKSAGDYLDTVPHSLGHKEALLSKVQPSGEALKRKKSGIKDIGNIKELHEDFEKTIKEVVMPMKEVMDEFQDIWDTIPPKERLKLIKLRLNRAALRKRFKTKTEGKHWELDSATNAYRKQKDKLKKETFKIKGWRKQHRENVDELKFDQQLKDAYDEFSKN